MISCYGCDITIQWLNADIKTYRAGENAVEHWLKQEARDIDNMK